MAKNFTGTGALALTGTYINDLVLVDPVEQLSLNIASLLTFTNGTGDYQCNTQWVAQRVVAAAANDDIDLAGGIADAFGDTITFTKIKAMLIQNLSGTGTLVVGGATNPFSSWLGSGTDTLVLPPYAAQLLVYPLGGYAVTAGTGDILRVAFPAAGPPASITYNIILWGVRS